MLYTPTCRQSICVRTTLLTRQCAYQNNSCRDHRRNYGNCNYSTRRTTRQQSVNQKRNCTKPMAHSRSSRIVNFLDIIAVAITGAINQTSSSPATKVANDSKSIPSWCPSDAQNLTQFFRDQREQLAADYPAYDQVPDRPSQTLDSFYLRDLADVDICPDSSAYRQQQLRNLCADFQDILIRPSRILLPTDLVYHSSNTGKSRPVKRPPRRLTLQ